MPTYSQGPHLLKGATVAIDSAKLERNTISFQYNPEMLNTSIQGSLSVSRPLSGLL